uniref:Uncharacterized protein n=1 Tax=Oryza brachyantha TaxID=4533 RepID=J3MXH5_ORYBR
METLQKKLPRPEGRIKQAGAHRRFPDLEGAGRRRGVSSFHLWQESRSASSSKQKPWPPLSPAATYLKHHHRTMR